VALNFFICFVSLNSIPNNHKNISAIFIVKIFIHERQQWVRISEHIRYHSYESILYTFMHMYFDCNLFVFVCNLFVEINNSFPVFDPTVPPSPSLPISAHSKSFYLSSRATLATGWFTAPVNSLETSCRKWFYWKYNSLFDIWRISVVRF